MHVCGNRIYSILIYLFWLSRFARILGFSLLCYYCAIDCAIIVLLIVLLLCQHLSISRGCPENARCGGSSPAAATGHHRPAQMLPEAARGRHRPPRPPQATTGRHRPAQAATGRHRPPEAATGHHRPPQAATGCQRLPRAVRGRTCCGGSSSQARRLVGGGCQRPPDKALRCVPAMNLFLW